jgi:pyruvate dehydrogenase E1 component alpha subunit
MSDPATYRSKEEVADYKKIDPIETTRASIIEKGFASEADLDKLEEEIMSEVDESVTFSENSPYPDPADLFRHVYVEDDYPYITD